MAVSLTWSVSVSYPSDTTATVSVTLKAKSTGGSYNHQTSTSYGYIKINGTKYGNFSHKFNANTTTTLGTKSHNVTRTTAAQSIPLYAWWHTDVSSGNISKSGSTTVAARPAYTVYFYNGYGGIHSTVGVYAGYTTTFPYISRTGYDFGSWGGYAQGAGTPAIWGNTSYTASWTPITYTIGYDLGNGSLLENESNPSAYTIESSDISLNRPKLTGYHFTGWTGTNGEVPQGGDEEDSLLIIPHGSTGDRAYTANYELNTYIVHFGLGEGEDEGATVEYNTKDKAHGETITVPVPEWSGHIFSGWATSDGQNIGTEECSLNGTTNREEIELTALWSDAARPIIFHYYKSATDINSTIISYKIINKNFFSDQVVTPIVNNYVFKGWYTDSERTVSWTEAFNYEDDLVFPSTDTVVDSEKTYYILQNETWTKVEAPTGNPSTSGYYELDYRHSADNPLHIYAKWNEEYTVVYNINNPSYNDGIEARMLSGAVTSKKFENGVQNTIGNTALFYAYGTGQCTVGHGWSTNSGLNNIKTHNDGAKLTISGQPAGYVLNLYAVWEPTTYKIYLAPGDVLSGTTIEIPKKYYESYLLPNEPSSEWNWTPKANHHLSNWLSGTTNIPLATTVTVKGDITYTAEWVDSYHVPVIPAQTGIITKRYVDASYTSTNEGGKYIQISAVGTHGSYDGVSVSKHTYSVDVTFYDTDIISVSTIPVATYVLSLTSNSETFSQVWGKPLSEEDPYARPLYDKKLNMLYCVLKIIDTTDYGVSIAEEKRTFTYEFEIPLKRAIAMHMADDLSAISMFEELAEGDKGLVINNNNVVINHLWTWKIDPTTKHMYLEWTGETNK